MKAASDACRHIAFEALSNIDSTGMMLSYAIRQMKTGRDTRAAETPEEGQRDSQQRALERRAAEARKTIEKIEIQLTGAIERADALAAENKVLRARLELVATVRKSPQPDAQGLAQALSRVFG